MPSPNLPPDDERDLLDQAMEFRIVRGTTARLRRIFGPSCVVTIVLFAIITIVFGKWVNLPPTGMLMLLFLIWITVFLIGVRFRDPGPE